ncbi:DUF1501 domain-containing protein [Pelomonas sp. SE-A7]|uniref:DUF1501 domain-containing protein n=1 Tax=Pelomonas sp. SE-A7 TaxID=3054953 RepID=UPI00259C8EF7|nr:DUF1501 domain-containing protein [Pelomonas sp. SE-A7]MDM4765677.1 DUF1501 domain-containing protein [Pelomonas sp. SE-A7]
MANISKLKTLQRREFLRRASALGLSGVAAPWALNLAALGEAAAQGAPNDYKALVCIFFYGGNDYANTIVPYDQASYNSYATIRQTIATPRDQLLALNPSVALPNSRQMALAPQLGPLKTLFDAGKLGVLLNVGTLVQPTTLAQYKAQSVPLPPKLFSHNDQQSVWQASNPEGATTGWGGRLGDLFLNGNGNATFTCINVSGNAVFMAGQQAVQYQLSTSGAVAINGITRTLFGSQACSDALRSLITAQRSHWMEQELNRVVSRSVNAQSIVSTALAGLPALKTTFDSANSLALQLQMVAKLIAARSSLGASRQVFFVSMGGFDLHDFLPDQHPGLLTNIANAMGSFHDAMVEIGAINQVTAFTASDFGRTMTSNGDGSDHGWGSHHFVMGGAVKGGKFFGQLPAIALNGPEDVGQGRLLPTTSVDQLGATLASWMGVSASNLPLVMPQIANYSVKDIGLFL